MFLAGWGLVVASAVLALFVHRGFLGIVGLVGAVVVARYTLW